MAVAVASGSACLSSFAVPSPGPVLLYAVEDSESALRSRLESPEIEGAWRDAARAVSAWAGERRLRVGPAWSIGRGGADLSESILIFDRERSEACNVRHGYARRFCLHCRGLIMRRRYRF